MSGSVEIHIVNNVDHNFYYVKHFFKKSKPFDWSDSISLIIWSVLISFLLSR